MTTRLCVMPSTSGGSYKIGSGVSRMGGCGVRDIMLKKGKGIGGVLLDGGIGSASSGGSYASVADYTRTTGMPIRGAGLEKLSKKISDLSIIAPKKKKNNINFEL